TVNRRMVGAPVERKRAVSGVMPGMRKPKPITIPAAISVCRTITSGNRVPACAACRRSRLVRATMLRAAGGRSAATSGCAVAAEGFMAGGSSRSDMRGLLGGIGARRAGRGVGEIHVLEGGGAEGVVLDRARLPQSLCPGHCCGGVLRGDREHVGVSPPAALSHRRRAEAADR